MHTDLQTLAVVCSHFKEYESEDLRKQRNKARRLDRALLREQCRRRQAEERAEAWRRAAHEADARYVALLTAVRHLGR